VSELGHHLFSWVCGQNPEHIWAMESGTLPCCQRCTGFYVGALAAVLLHLWLHPRPNRRFLFIHAVLVLQVGLFAWPFVPQPSWLRSASGVAYAFGTVAFLTVLPLMRWSLASEHQRGKEFIYAAGLLGIGALVPVLAMGGGRSAQAVLSGLATMGLFALSALALANIGLLLRPACNGAADFAKDPSARFKTNCSLRCRER
jgi:hypothetical protein